MSPDSFRRLPAFTLHAQFASLELSMPITKSKGGGVALPRGPSIEFAGPLAHGVSDPENKSRSNLATS